MLLLRTIRSLTAVLALGVGAGVFAADYPTKPVRIVVGFVPGGGTDITARTMAPPLTESLGQQVIVENRAGAAGNIATAFVARAPADGHTLLLGTIAALALSPNLRADLPFDPIKDFAPITQVVSIGMAIVVHPVLPAKNVKEFIALARARPGELSYAASGPGSPNHLAGELFKKVTGTNLVHVAYKGGGQAVVDVLGGHVPVFFAVIPSAIKHVKSGRLRALAVTTLTRAAALPGVPTVAEAGYDGFEADNWYGLLAPAGTPQPIIDQLHKETVSVLKSPGVSKALADQGINPTTSTPEAFSAFIKSENAKWAGVMRDIGLKAK